MFYLFHGISTPCGLSNAEAWFTCKWSVSTVIYSKYEKTNIRIREMFICIEIPKHWRLSLVQVRKVYWLLEFSLSRRGERETQFLLCWPFHLTQQTHGASRRPQTGLTSSSFKSQLASPSFGYQLTAFFPKSPRIPAHHSQAWRHSHPRPIFHLWFLLWHLWLSHPPSASVNTCAQCVYLHVH